MKTENVLGIMTSTSMRLNNYIMQVLVSFASITILTMSFVYAENSNTSESSPIPAPSSIIPSHEQIIAKASFSEAPLKQVKHGVKAYEVKCKSGLGLILKQSNSMPACVSSSTKKVLIERGWGIVPQSINKTENQTLTISPTVSTPIHIISVQVLPVNPKVGDLLSFNMTFKNNSTFPVYLVAGCGSQLSISTSDNITEQIPFPRCMCAEHTVPLDPNQIASAFAPNCADGYNLKAAKPGILLTNVTLHWGIDQFNLINSTSILVKTKVS